MNQQIIGTCPYAKKDCFCSRAPRGSDNNDKGTLSACQFPPFHVTKKQHKFKQTLDISTLASLESTPQYLWELEVTG